MALSGIQIYKLLPQTNCKDCGFPTCLAFAMKLAAKQVELSSCKHVKPEAKAQLAESSEPPVRLVALKSSGFEVKAGNEVVLFRHEKTFYNKPGVFLRVNDQEEAAALQAKVTAAERYTAGYVGMDLKLDGIAVQGTGSPEAFAKAISTVRAITKRPLILIHRDPAAMGAGLKVVAGERPLVHAANAENWQAMGALAKQHGAALVVSAPTLDELAGLTAKLKEMGVEDLVLDPQANTLGKSLVINTQIRRLALRKNFRPLGYPIIIFPGDCPDAASEAVLAAHGISKYAGFVVLERLDPEMIYPLLVMRENIYTDPQKPIQVLPGVYEINNPKPDSPVLVTTNFSITYFSVANEVESSGLPAWLVVTDAEGMSVLTAWAAGKFDAERIAKAIKTYDVASKISRKRIVIPGQVAVLSGELEEELSGWEIRVGPREAVDLPAFMKQAL